MVIKWGFKINLCSWVTSSLVMMESKKNWNLLTFSTRNGFIDFNLIYIYLNASYNIYIYIYIYIVRSIYCCNTSVEPHHPLICNNFSLIFLLFFFLLILYLAVPFPPTFLIFFIFSSLPCS